MYFLNEIITNTVDSKIVKYVKLKSHYFMCSLCIISQHSISKRKTYNIKRYHINVYFMLCHQSIEYDFLEVNAAIKSKYFHIVMRISCNIIMKLFSAFN